MDLVALLMAEFTLTLLVQIYVQLVALVMLAVLVHGVGLVLDQVVETLIPVQRN
jgi:hypothetical protein